MSGSVDRDAISRVDAVTPFGTVVHLANGAGLRASLVRGGVGSIGLKIASIGLGLGMAVVLARSLGAERYGVYSYAYALISLLSVPAQFGLPTLVVRETAKAEASGDWGRMRGVWRWSNMAAALLSLAIALVCGVATYVFGDTFSAQQLMTFVWGLILIPLIALGSLRGAALRGLHKVVQGQLPEQLIRPVLFIALMILSNHIVAGGRINASEAMALHALSAGIGFVIGAYLLRLGWPAPIRTRPSPAYESRRWLTSAVPLAFVASITILNSQVDIVMLGIFGTAEGVGVYRVASRGATLVPLGYTAIALVLAPYMARFRANQDQVRLQQIATAGATVGLLLALPVLLAFVFFGGDILGIVFGPEYSSGYVVLVILGGAQLLHVGFGMVGYLLNMCGHERDTMKGMGAGLICNIGASLILIPLYGATGAAISSAVSLVVLNIILWRIARRELGVDGAAFNIANVWGLIHVRCGHFSRQRMDNRSNGQNW